MKKLLLFFLFSILAVAQTWAQTFIVDGIGYRSLSTSSSVNKTAAVVALTYTGSVVIPSTVTYEGVTYRVIRIDFKAFQGCSDLTSVTIPKTVTRIDDSAFDGCTRLTSITIPDSVASISNFAFANCSGLTSVTIPSSVTSIGNYAFCNCSGLTSVTIPSSVTTIDYWAFSDCYIENSKFVNKSSCTSEDMWGATLCDKEQADGLLIKGSVAVSCRKWATSVTVPSSVTSIGKYAFAGSDLTSVTIPSSVTSIGIRAFYGCQNLTDITIPETVTYIGSEAFEDCI